MLLFCPLLRLFKYTWSDWEVARVSVGFRCWSWAQRRALWVHHSTVNTWYQGLFVLCVSIRPCCPCPSPSLAPSLFLCVSVCKCSWYNYTIECKSACASFSRDCGCAAVWLAPSVPVSIHSHSIKPCTVSTSRHDAGDKCRKRKTACLCWQAALWLYFVLLSFSFLSSMARLDRSGLRPDRPRAYTLLFLLGE